MMKNARELGKYRPILYGIGMICIMPRITDEQLHGYNGTLKTDGDEREGEIILYTF